MPHLVVAVDGERSLVLPLKNQGGNLADHPDGTHDMVGVTMGNKHVANLLKRDSSLHELNQDTIAATTIDQHPATR